MIQTDANKITVKNMRELEKKQADDLLREKCIGFANEKWGEEELKKLSSTNKGLWFLPVMDEEGNIEKFALMKPIDRHILSYASTKMTEGGLYVFLEECMRACFVDGDKEILDDDDYFIPAATSFNKILEGKKAALLKR